MPRAPQMMTAILCLAVLPLAACDWASVQALSANVAGAIADAPASGAAIEAPADEVARALAKLNAARAQAHLDPAHVDADLSRGAALHAKYLVLNWGNPLEAGVLAHSEDATLPGATKEGALAGEQSVINYLPLPEAIDSWLGTCFHRLPLLRTSSTSVGMGEARDGDHLAVLLRFPEIDRMDEHGEPVEYPADGQTDVPLAMVDEVPYPLRRPANGEGYPITFEPMQEQKLWDATATLTDGNGQDVPFYPVIDESTGYFVQAMIPKQRLQPGTTYHASITGSLDGTPTETWTWSFTTIKAPAVDASDRPQLAP